MGAYGSVVDIALVDGSNAICVAPTVAGPAWTGVGSVVVSNAAINVDVTVSDYVSIIGSPNYSLPVQVSAGTALMGSVVADVVRVRNMLGSVEISNAEIAVNTTTADYISVVGSPNYSLPTTPLGSVQVSSIVGALPAGTSLLGSVVASPVGYFSVLGSPNYLFPVVGSVQVSSIVGALPAGTALLGSVIATPVGVQTILGSVEVSNTLNVDVTVSDYISIVGSPNYSLPVIGSVNVSSITGALPAGTALLGSVVADIVGLSTSDYVSVVGSPNYSLPVIGSVQVSSINSALPAGTAILGSVKAEITASVALDVNTTTADYISIVGSPNYSLPVIGSVQVSSITGALPAGTATLGSVKSEITAWSTVGSMYNTEWNRDGSSITFDWVGPVTGSVMGIPASGSRYNITHIACTASGQGIVTLFFNSDNTSGRIVKAPLANFGGFMSTYPTTKPLRGPTNGSLLITTAATGFTPVGFVTVSLFQSA